MRKKIVAGNWKMNCDLSQTEHLLTELKQEVPTSSDVVVMVAPPYINLFPAVRTLKETNIKVAAQNMHKEAEGAYTGEISAKMLKSVGVDTVILGHSERRKYFQEDHYLLREKVEAALKNDMEVIFCFGEKLEDREVEDHFKVVQKQLSESLFEIAKEDWDNIILAYEPVWAIGTGKTASADQAQEMHAFIREVIARQYDQATADEVSILYGGSVKPGNAAELFAKKDVDGGLIGGASLNAADFIGIIKAFD